MVKLEYEAEILEGLSFEVGTSPFLDIDVNGNVEKQEQHKTYLNPVERGLRMPIHATRLAQEYGSLTCSTSILCETSVDQLLRNTIRALC